MNSMSIIAMAGTKRDLMMASTFPPDVQWDKIVKVEIPDNHGCFPDLSGYDMSNFHEFSSDMEDDALYPYMTKCVDAVLDFTVKKAVTMEALNFQDVSSSISGMNTGGAMFVVAGFVNWEPMRIEKKRPFLVSAGRN